MHLVPLYATGPNDNLSTVHDTSESAMLMRGMMSTVVGLCTLNPVYP
jgi:hypothetical protein